MQLELTFAEGPHTIQKPTTHIRLPYQHHNLVIPLVYIHEHTPIFLCSLYCTIMQSKYIMSCIYFLYGIIYIINGLG